MIMSLQPITGILRSYPALGLALQALGALTLLSCLSSLTSFVFRTFLRGGIGLKKFGAGTGAWAVITGASDGIGREFALQLADKGFNVLLAARNADKLEAVAREIQQKTGNKVQTECFTIDFASAPDSRWDVLHKVVQAKDVGILVNNVGKSHEMPTDFIETPKEEMHDILAINVQATVRVTALVAPGMVSRHRGLILSLGSFAGSAPSPMLATYSASKAFLRTFSQALSLELSPKGVTVEHSNTYFVVSAMSKIRRSTLMIPTPRSYVKSVLGKVAPGSMSPFWTHAVLEYVMGLVPEGVVSWYMYGLHRDIRKRALRKKEREAKKQ
ncbi:3-ketoacyl-CoA reductase [Peniophora sp. CONT]|nr:3-ketoacyl-CoA reductase [Peniophora sp. CONT]